MGGWSVKDYRGYWRMIFNIAQEAVFYLQKLFVNDKLSKASKVYVIPKHSIPLNKKAQSIAEYAVFISMMVAAIAMMQLYVKRGLQARYGDAAYDLVEKLNDSSIWLKDPTDPQSIDISITPVTAYHQFEPDEVESRKTQRVIEDKLVYKMEKGGNVTRDIVTRTQNEVQDHVIYHYP